MLSIGYLKQLIIFPLIIYGSGAIPQGVAPDSFLRITQGRCEKSGAPLPQFRQGILVKARPVKQGAGAARTGGENIFAAKRAPGGQRPFFGRWAGAYGGKLWGRARAVSLARGVPELRFQNL